jgi:hypothetical protein
VIGVLPWLAGGMMICLTLGVHSCPRLQL